MGSKLRPGWRPSSLRFWTLNLITSFLFLNSNCVSISKVSKLGSYTWRRSKQQKLSWLLINPKLTFERLHVNVWIRFKSESKELRILIVWLPRFSIFCEYVQIWRIFTELCRYVQIRRKNVPIKSTVKTSQRCQTKNKDAKNCTDLWRTLHNSADLFRSVLRP